MTPTSLLGATLKVVGWWPEDEDDDRWVHPRLLVSQDWVDGETIDHVVSYLQKGQEIMVSPSPEKCLFADGSDTLGSALLTDGVWVWPESLAVYVGRYGVQLPEAFLTHMREQGFAPPTVDAAISDPDGRTGLKFDFKYWVEWCRAVKARAVGA